MRIRNSILYFVFFSFLVFCSGYTAEAELLKKQDISHIMNQIFSQHVDKKEMSGDILKNAFRVYIDQFDPSRIYLLQSEATPWLNISDARLKELIAQYKNNDFNAFVQLNDLIQKSIERARNLRQELESQPAPLFATTPTDLNDNNDWTDPDLKKPFPADVPALKAALAKEITLFIEGEKRRFGADKIMKNQDSTLAILNRNLEGHENGYLLRAMDGSALTPAKQENLLVMHVLKALASSLDAHTTFYNDTEAYDMKMRLEKAFEGIGVVLNQREDGAVVISKLIDGGPAALSGKIAADDRIIEINGNNVSDSTLKKVMELMRGENGSQISLLLQRGKDKIPVTLKRAPITLNDDRVDISYVPYEDGIIGKITLHAFYQGENGVTSEQDLRKAIKELQKKGTLKGLVLDLRENSGGFLTQAVKVGGLFITNGIIVISKYSDGKEHFYRDMDGKVSYSGPLVVLTSKATASAAEIVAQALQDYGIALVVGDPETYGKGTIQTQTVTDEGASSFFKVTVGKYYTVSGNTPQINGVKADIVVPGKFSQEHIGERYLPAALKPDSIPSEFKDDLSDVEPGLRTWYLRYYMPTLQKKSTVLDNELSILKQNSHNRIERNADYQLFLKALTDPHAATALEEKKVNPDELQMAEAVNIVKDMIQLQVNGAPSHSIAKTQKGD